MIEVYNYADLGSKHSWDYTRSGTTPKDDGIDPIFVTDSDIDVGSVLIIAGTAYSVVCTSGHGGVTCLAYVRKLQNQCVFAGNQEPNEIWGASELTCPFCGAEHEDAFELDDEDDEYECGNCGSLFSYSRHITVTYQSSPVKRAETLSFNTESKRDTDGQSNKL